MTRKTTPQLVDYSSDRRIFLFLASAVMNPTCLITFLVTGLVQTLLISAKQQSDRAVEQFRPKQLCLSEAQMYLACCTALLSQS